MKKLFLLALALVSTVCLAACGEQNKPTKTSGEVVVSGEATPEKDEPVALSNEDAYKEVMDQYKNAWSTYDIEDFEGEEEFFNNHLLVNPAIITHLARYKEEGLELTFKFYDIDKNGIDELIVGVSGSPAAIYSRNEDGKVVSSIIYLDTIERGSLVIYDNGVILCQGAGGAALHYYSFGKIAADKVDLEELASIEEEYVEGKDTPVYKDHNTGDVLEYTSLDEIMNKYVSGANEIKF